VVSIAERIAACLPGASFELESLVRLVGVVETTEVPSAAVTVSERARLLVNPGFVETHCRRDEHLFLLVMHEMWHVLLGHTTLYPRTTRAHNIAFDALINAGLARQHPQPAYRGFFEAINPPDRFPALLLRPPVGWPKVPHYEVPGPPGTGRILRRLYPRNNEPSQAEPLFEEIMRLLSEIDPKGNDGFLGDHSADPADPMGDPLFSEVVREVVGKWGPPPKILRGRNSGGSAFTSWFEPRHASETSKAALAKLLRKACLPDPVGSRRIHRRHVRVPSATLPVPSAADRTAPARKALGQTPVLFTQPATVLQRVPDVCESALIYLDVSGSMAEMLPHLLAVLIQPARQRLIHVRQFSTEVYPLSLQDLQRGELTTTEGTDIRCVAEDLLASPFKRAVILTDGYVGQPPQPLISRLREREVRVWAGVPESGWEDDLRGWVEAIVTIPEVS